MALRTERLREIREKRGLSQRELARLCGFAEVMIYRYETATSDPSSAFLTLIAQKLDVSADYLLGLSDNPKGQLGDTTLTDDENTMLNTYRREGWSGVIHLGAERMAR